MASLTLPEITPKDIQSISGKKQTAEEFTREILADYKLGRISREASLLGRKEVLTGKAKFGILGDGKELPQLALSKVFENGDFRSGYYRDQTLMLALGNVTVTQLFTQLYAHPNLKEEPHSAGRQMNAHFATRSLNEKGEWNNLMQIKNTSADISSTAAQMPRAVGLALASKKYRQVAQLQQLNGFSNNGNEITFVTIGDASTSEGHFWEAMNAAGVLQIPMVVSVWDDGYGISVPIEFQTTKGSISELMSGFKTDELGRGIDLYTVYAWNYPELLKTYRQAAETARKTHRPALIHVKEVTQPQGHSTSGSQERYKSKERLQWEAEHDCLLKMRQWIIETGISDAETLDAIDSEAKDIAREAQKKAWAQFMHPIQQSLKELEAIYLQLQQQVAQPQIPEAALQTLKTTLNPTRRDVAANARKTLRLLRHENPQTTLPLKEWTARYQQQNHRAYADHLYSQSAQAIDNIKTNPPVYSQNSPVVNGFEVLNACFDAMLQRDPRVVAFGEDVGKIGDVNQGFAGMQAKHGIERVFDTGIREVTIIGQGIGMAMRGLRPIAEIQYLDYFIYGLQPVSDDLATLQYRTFGGQKAPLIIRTRGHRLEGIWHTGSPIGMLLNSVRGVHLLVPRNMTQAAAMYNTMLLSDEPAIIIECLNGYRLKEKLPDNIADITLALGTPEVLRSGTDITLVTYGSCCRIVMEAAEELQEMGISCEVIDVQTLLPFDVEHQILQSVKKTNRLLVIDEDVPGGASAYILQQILEQQGAYYHLDSAPATLTALPSRCAYGSDADYYCKPGPDDVTEKVYAIMQEAAPKRFPLFL
ncbi:transketolase [Sphingobacteriales bacterium UPWRP_1]|nr:transketolase [Sphingobacteriales bacterium TSM_CSM]PSJ78861.1 transketolase [Sphingobacteriales bacterium UPWRP_1]